MPARLVGVRGAFLMGSLQRGTHLHAAHDVDVCVVLDEDSWRATRHRGPGALLRRFCDVVHASGGGFEANLQNRSVALRGADPSRACDLVPAFHHPWKAGVYVIPDVARDAWIATCPDAHLALNRAANARTGGMANRVIRRVKRWNLERGKPLRSFQIEVVACAVLRAPVAPAHGERLVLDRLAESLRAPLPDPTGVGPPIDDGYLDDRRSRAVTALFESAPAGEVLCPAARAA